MDRISHDDLRTLVATRRGPCATLLLPTVRAGAETRQNAIRFKNLLRQLEDQLAARGLEKAALATFLAPLARRVDDSDFWQHQDLGLAVYRAPDLLRMYRVPLPLTELAVVEDRFHVKTLFPLFDGDGTFHLLALSQKRCRLFRGNRHGLEEVALAGIPTALTEALGTQVTGVALQAHSAGGHAAGTGRAGRGTVVYHAQGGVEEDDKAELRKFFNLLDRGVVERIGRGGGPLVLAGVDYLHPIYREVSDHPALVAQGLAGNADELRAEQLHARAWPLVEPYFLAARAAAADRFRERVGIELASASLGEALAAAVDGRVESLFVARGVRRWGRFDGGTRTVTEVEVPGPEVEDLLDLAAVETYLHGGKVYAVEPEEVPGGSGLAAVFRY